MINKFSILNGAKYFYLGIFQNYLVFIPAKKYIKYFSGTTPIDSWKSNGMSEETIENITKSDSNFSPTFVDHHLLPDMIFNGHCLIKKNISIPKKGVLLKPATTDPPTTNPPNTYQLPTDPPTTYPSTYVKTEDQILNMLGII